MSRFLLRVSRRVSRLVSSARRACLPLVVICVALKPMQASAQLDPPRHPLPDEIEALLDAKPLPSALVDPTRRFVLLVHERKLLELDKLAEPAVALAGRRIELRTASVHAPLHYYGLTLVDLHSGQEAKIALPRGGVIGYPQWAPDGSRFAFTLSRGTGTELWIGDPQGGHASRLVRGVKASHGSPCAWAADSRRLLCEMDVAPNGPGRAAADRDALFDIVTQQSSLELPIVLSAELTRNLLEAQLEMIDSRTGGRRPIGPPTAFQSVSPSPGGVFFLVERIVEPYPQVSGVDATRRATEVWDLRGNVVRRLPAAARAVQWHASRPSTLAWVERREGRDRLRLLPPPYTDRALDAFVFPHAFSDLRFIGDTDAVLVSDYDRDRRHTELWHVDLSRPGHPAHAVVDYPSAFPQSPLMGSNTHGMRTVVEHDGSIYWRGSRRDGDRQYVFLDLVSLVNGKAKELWADSAPRGDRLVDALSSDGRFLLLRRGTSASPPNYLFVDQQHGRRRPITQYEHPASALADARRIPLRYHRDDGLALGATLYLPPDYRGDAPLPAVLWAYPRRMLTNEDSRPVVASTEFPSFERAFRLFFLLQGYAVLDDVSMPIIGSEDSANDTFIEQIVANASAAIAAARATGHVDAGRVGVAGHSYGAFMVANLLAHSRLFAAGAALSGAYNRTLTPFGFQTERRTLWEARDTYLAMSPILYSHQIEAPLLLVHGLNDDNAGTSPLQSTQLYSAIRGNGGDAELLLLPWEGHSYRARESVLDTAAQMLQWFDRNLKDPIDFGVQEETGASLRPPN